jgi:hypothetical protein
VWANSPSFVGKLVVFDASITADGMHLALLLDSSCNRGLRFDFAPSVKPEHAKAIDDAIWKPWPGTSGKTISGRFTGVLRRDQSETRFRPYVFEVTHIGDLKINIGQRPW